MRAAPRAVAIALAVATAFLGACSDETSADTTTTSSSVPPSVAPTSEAEPPTTSGPNTVPTSEPAAVDALDPVPADEAAELLPGMLLRVVEVERADLVGQGPGDSTGPGIAVSVSMANSTQETVDFSTLMVTAQRDDGTPLLSSRSEPAKVPEGELAPGEEGLSVWTFHIEGDPAGTILQVTHPASPSIVQFTI